MILEHAVQGLRYLTVIARYGLEDTLRKLII